jgi:hypothetical protein
LSYDGDSLFAVLHWLHDHLQFGNVPMWVSGLAAAFSALFGYKSYRASKRAKGAQDEAARQANRAVEAQNKIAEEIKRLGDDRARQREDEERAPWRIEKLARDDYLLVNLSQPRSTTYAYTGRLSGRMAATTFARSAETAPSASISLSGRSNFRTVRSR